MANINVSIQKLWLLYKLRKELYNITPLINSLFEFTHPPEIINMFNPEITYNERFEKCSKILTNKDNIKQTIKFMRALYKVKKIDPEIAPKIMAREFLSCWMIVSFPVETIGKKVETINNIDEYPDDIYFVSKELIEKLNIWKQNPKNNENKRLLFKQFNKYSNAITYFMQRDKEENTFKLIREYCDITKTIFEIKSSRKYSEDEKVSIICEIKKTQNIIYTNLQTYSRIDRKELDVRATLSIVIGEKLEEEHYKLLLEDITSKKLEHLPNVINEIKHELVKLNATKTSDGKNINEILDAELLSNIIKNTTLELSSVKLYGNYLIGIITQLQSFEATHQTTINWTNLYTEYDNGQENNSSEYLAKMLFLIMKEIRDIKENIINVSALLNAGFDIFNMK